MDTGDAELEQVAHESLTLSTGSVDGVVVPDLDDVLTFDSVQHLVSLAAGEAAMSPRRSSLRDRIARLLDTVSGPRHERDTW
jgi:hypothetical protein